ncbi:type II toxin-antitoxin system HipA family toxin [Psychromonas hadalis]|uniref:type II toxin-antitoxin system HipA family toxin n=1 Tax=Psychromonas hadalis TaxID=211669 RepID=UPI0003B4583C|nr:HipA domain-containing protein [Psychromonas hadalis]
MSILRPRPVTDNEPLFIALSTPLQNPQESIPTQIDVRYHAEQKFSLAGVQLKFSSTRNKDGRFNINQDDDIQSWIIKTPSTIHPHLPSNEYSMMRLAESVAIEIPEIKLVPLSQLNNLPNIQLPNEELAFARSLNGRVHTEDFAQIFQYYPVDKYQRANYEEIGAVLRRFSGDSLADIQQFARRLLVNILLGNGDAHLKNWSVIYQDKQTPRLSPAYDIVFTPPYIQGEDKLALNMAKTKDWYRISLNTFEIWATRTETPWPAVKVYLLDVITQARKQWPRKLTELPMNEKQKDQLRGHW